MPALLRSFAFDEPTTAYLQKALEKRKEEAFGQMMFNAYQFEDEEAAPLQGLPDGDYTLLIGADLENDTTARLILMNAETQQVIKKVDFDLSPVIQSAILYRDEYSQAWGFDSEDEGEQQTAEQNIEEIEKIRYACLTDILAPYAQSHPALQGELLEALDFLTGYYIEDRLTDLSPEAILQDRLNDPLNKFIPPSHTLH
ncbi:MAG: hypothetical protein HYS17_04960 [Micavibrio aeruginosavorus]|uniref:Uncharacterized protein n=1 Tax=Micavibrio aeruginosavorus TaxID=349221 RepID=A0A7T5R3Y6_9BACT|nr:MAG: hypothetical protein HYS17_04960 [Micavibrio aeruginosavorus]